MRDVLLHEHRQTALRHCERAKRKYEKQDTEYWETRIVESRKTKINSKKCRTNQIQNEVSLQEQTISKYKDMTVKQLKAEIMSQHLKVKGLAKMRKGQLIDILESAQ